MAAWVNEVAEGPRDAEADEAGAAWANEDAEEPDDAKVVACGSAWFVGTGARAARSSPKNCWQPGSVRCRTTLKASPMWDSFLAMRLSIRPPRRASRAPYAGQ